MGCNIQTPLDCLSSAAKSVAGDAFDAIAHDFGTAAERAINWLWGQLSSSAAVNLGGHAFNVDLGIVGAITGIVAVGLFTIQVIVSALRRDPGGLARAFRGLLVAFIAGGAAIGITNLLLGAIDALSAGVVQATMGTDLTGMGGKVLAGGDIMLVKNPAALMLLSNGAIAAAVIVWFALMVRKVLIVVSAVFAPLAFAGSLADITVTWTRKWIEVMAALIISKLVLVIIFVVGWGVLDAGVGQAGTSPGQSVTQTAAGLLILGVAGLSPWLALRFVHFTEDQFHRIHLLGASALGGAQAAAAVPHKVAAWKSTAASLGASRGGQALPAVNRPGQSGRANPAVQDPGQAGDSGASANRNESPGNGSPAADPTPSSQRPSVPQSNTLDGGDPGRVPPATPSTATRRPEPAGPERDGD